MQTLLTTSAIIIVLVGAIGIDYQHNRDTLSTQKKRMLATAAVLVLIIGMLIAFLIETFA